MTKNCVVVFREKHFLNYYYFLVKVDDDRKKKLKSQNKPNRGEEKNRDIQTK